MTLEAIALARRALRGLRRRGRLCRLCGRRGRILRIYRHDVDLRRRCARLRHRLRFLADNRNGGDRCRCGADARGCCRRGRRCGWWRNSHLFLRRCGWWRRHSRLFRRRIGVGCRRGSRCRRRDSALHRVIVVHGRRGNRRGRIADARIFDRTVVRAQQHHVGSAGRGYQEPSGNHQGLAGTRHACSPIMST